jgi:hypothetical protein
VGYGEDLGLSFNPDFAIESAHKHFHALHEFLMHKANDGQNIFIGPSKSVILKP